MFLNIKKYSLLFMDLDYHEFREGMLLANSAGSCAASDYKVPLSGKK